MTSYQADEFAGDADGSAADLAGVPDAFQRLWTPHRLAYIQHGQQPDEHACPFCTAPEMDDEQALIVARGEHAYVLLNLFPYNSGHLLVCPYRHVATYDEATRRRGRRDRRAHADGHAGAEAGVAAATASTSA